MFHAVRSVFGLLLLGAFMLAHAALPTGTLEYTQRLGVVGANESIELRLRFTLDPGSTPLSFNSDPLTGFAAADLPTTSPVYDPVTKTFVDVPIAPGSIHSATLVSFYVCDGSFFVGCDGGGEYSWTWGGDEPGHPNPSNKTSFDLQPGDTIEYLLGTLDPKPGGAAPGIYRFGLVGLQINFAGADAAGAPLTGYHGLGSACGGANADCAFTREVRAVPAPSVPLLLIAPLLFLFTRGRYKLH